MRARELLWLFLKMHDGLYRGLHIAPIGQLGDQDRGCIEQTGSYASTPIAANHGTGLSALEKRLELGYPSIRDTGSNGSQGNLYKGNGDPAVFG